MPTAVTFTVNGPPTPTKTNFANLDDADAVPYLHDRGRSQYQVFLTKSQPRAFALSPSGAWSWAEDGDDPNERALANCQKNSDLPCKLYAVDDYVVWDGNS